jgi:hypothetical protein
VMIDDGHVADDCDIQRRRNGRDDEELSEFPVLSRDFGAGGFVLPSHHVLEEADRCLPLLALLHTGRYVVSWIGECSPAVERM